MAIFILFSLGDGLIRCVVRTAIEPRIVARGIRPLVTDLREPPGQPRDFADGETLCKFMMQIRRHPVALCASSLVRRASRPRNDH